MSRSARRCDRVCRRAHHDARQRRGSHNCPTSAILRYAPDADPRQVCHELGVQQVLLGFVQKLGAQWRVSIQLLDPVARRTTFSEKYDFRMEDVFEVQDESGGAWPRRSKAGSRPRRRSRTTATAAIVAETTALAGSTTESLRNIELVKSLGLAQQEIDRLNATTEKILTLELKEVRYLRSLGFVQGTLVNLLRTSILLLMLYLIYTGSLTVGQFISLFLYSLFIFGPLQELGNVIGVYREAEVSLNAFEAILRMPEEPRPASPAQVGPLERLTFEHVGFMHQSATLPALTDISFEVSRGDVIAFVGPSGSGETTLVKLLVALYMPKTGRILYNGRTSHTIDLDAVRKRIGFVTRPRVRG